VGGQPPLSVVIGNADATEVWVRGKVFDIKSIAQGNVARFEVK
jgi:cytoskeleton protein RodZ